MCAFNDGVGRSVAYPFVGRARTMHTLTLLAEEAEEFVAGRRTRPDHAVAGAFTSAAARPVAERGSTARTGA